MKLFKIFILAFFVVSLIACGGAEERKAVYLEKAKASIEAGDLDKARIELKNVLQIDPKDAEAYYQLGKVFELKKNYRKAYVNYLRAEELNPELLENQARLGRFYLVLMNDLEKAQEKIDLILSKEPENPDGLLLKAVSLLRKGNNDEGMKIIKDITVRDIGHTESALILASLYIKENKASDAINLLDAALKNNKNNEQLKKLLASALVVNKDYERAEVIYKKFLERNPGNSSNYNSLAAFYNQTGDKTKAEDVLRASINNKADDEDRILTLIKYIKATKGIDKAILELKSFIAANNGLGKLRGALADLYILNNDKQAAVKVLKQAINDFSEEVTGVAARTALASIYISDKDYEKASAVVEDAASISPNDPQINYLKAKFAVRNKDFEKAIISLRIVTKETPENIGAFLLLANVYQQKNDVEQAKRILNSAYENNITNADALLKLAQFYFKRDTKQAEKIIDNYNSLKNSDYDGLSIKSAILNQNKKYSDAYEIARILMELYPDKPNGYLQAIQYLNQQGNKQQAISVLEKGYINTKDNKKILTLLTTLQVFDKKFDIVINRLNKEIESSPEDVGLKLLLAKVYVVNKNTVSAETVLNEVISVAPETEEAYLLLSQLYLSKKDAELVKEVLLKGKENVKASVKIPFKLASTYEVDGSYKKAIDIYRDLYQKHPDNLLIINNLASMLSDYGNKVSDLDLMKVLVSKLEVNSQPIFLDTIGWVYYKLGDYQKSVQYSAKAVEKSPKINVFNYHLGMAYKKVGDTVQAKIYLEKSLTSDKPFKQKKLAQSALKGL